MTARFAIRMMLALGAAMWSLPAADALAQERGIVQAAYGVDVRRFSGDEDDRVFDANATSVTVMGSVMLTRYVSAGVELDLGGTSSTARVNSVAIAGRPTDITTTYSLGRRTLSAMAGLHTAPASRVQFGAYAGLSFNSTRQEIATDAPSLVISGPLTPSVFIDRTTSALVGADLAVRVSPAVAVVGSLRAQGLTVAGALEGFAVRPSAGLRLRF